MPLATRIKDPDANLYYGFDWTDWLGSGDSISSVVWTITAGITKGAEVTGSYIAKVKLSGGTVGETYSVACKITTADGDVDERTMEINAEER